MLTKRNYFLFISMLYVISMVSLSNSVKSYATQDLHVGDSYINPVVGIGAYGVTIINFGNSTAKNIKFNLIDVDDAYTIVQETPLKDTLGPVERMDTKYILTPKKLGSVELQYVIQWEDEDGNKYSEDNKDRPVVLFNESFATSETPAPTGFSTTQVALIGSGVAIIAVIGGLYLAKMKKKSSVPSP